jgi:hypothetical protein
VVYKYSLASIRSREAVHLGGLPFLTVPAVALELGFDESGELLETVGVHEGRCIGPAGAILGIPPAATHSSTNSCTELARQAGHVCVAGRPLLESKSSYSPESASKNRGEETLPSKTTDRRLKGRLTSFPSALGRGCRRPDEV